MQPLPSELRSKLDKTVVAAREVAETAARAALTQLGVGEAKVYPHLGEEQRALRVRLRAHGRQLGDAYNAATRAQETARLAEQVAYEHWHRMLFARFLAENGLLIHPDYGVSVTLEECEELAAGEGTANGWELAGRFAARMLPQIFRPDSPVLALTLAPEHQRALEALLAGLPPAVFTAPDALGWVYQFWQSKRKDEINKSEVKIGARELPAVTQLFTEPYMVAFLLDNALGAWWAAQRLTPADLRDAPDEETLRARAALPGVPLAYLRFVRGEDGAWTPAAGRFEAWPAHLRDFKVLDPCCGSGHFLVAALHMLVPIRMAREGLDARAAVDAVLRENLHGLEIDSRCVEIAAFALALAAWAYPGAGGYRPLPPLRVACSGLAVGSSKAEWLAVAQAAADRIAREQAPALLPAGQETIWATQLKAGMGALYDLFEQAPTLGSLIDPTRVERTFFQADYAQVRELLRQALAADETPGDDDYEAVVAAQGMADAAELLAGHYDWVITNPPYLIRRKHNEDLRDYCDTTYPRSQLDLATVFLQRCLEFCQENGITSMVLPQNWLFLTSYRKLREHLLTTAEWQYVARLGPAAFETISGEVVKAVLLAIRASTAEPDHTILGIDASEQPTPVEKAEHVAYSPFTILNQQQQLRNPDSRFVIAKHQAHRKVDDFADVASGMSTFDRPQFMACYWELSHFTSTWELCQSTVPKSVHFGGCEYAILWENGQGRLLQMMEQKRILEGYTSGIWRAGSQHWGSRGVLVTLMGDLTTTLYCRGPYDQNAGLLVPKQPSDLPAIWSYCSSVEYPLQVRKMDQKVNVTSGTLVKVPFDLDHWTQVAAERYPHGLPQPYSDDPTQWIFHGHPCGSVVWDETTKRTAHGPLRTDAGVLQVAVARLLGYRWPAELDGTMELAPEQREWVDRCAALLPCADPDGIVCLPSVRGEAPAHERLLSLLAAAYGATWGDGTLRALLAAADAPGRDLAWWLRERFFAQHCALFHQRPFIWHIWDGLRDGFGALVNYHRLDRRALETLIYTYLGDWISRQRVQMAEGTDGAEERLAAAEALQKRLALILDGEAPYDIFVRWKPLARQAIGWEPDLNDGVRLNIRPFLSVPDVGRRGAGVLRERPNIKWEKDRGTDVSSAPWYDLGPRYGGKPGDRINNHHLTLAEKRAARTTTGSSA